MKVLKWLDDKLEETVLVVLLMIMALIMGGQVCARYLFNYSLSWTEEVTRYLFVWSGFLAISFTTQKGIAIRIEQLLLSVKPRLKKVILVIDYVIEFVFFGYMIPFGWRYFLETLQGGQTSVACEMPMWIVRIAPLIGFVLVEIRLIERIIREVRRNEVAK